MKARGYFLAIISAVFYGLIPLFIVPVKSAGFSLNVFLFYRFGLSAIALVLILGLKGTSFRVNSKQLIILLSLGLAYSLSTDSLFYAYDLLSPGIASIILFVFPVFVALIMSAFGEKISTATITALVITTLGILALGSKENLSDINYFGLSVAVLSALFYATYVVIVKQSRMNVSGIKLSFYSLAFSSLYFLLKVIFHREKLIMPATIVMVNLSMIVIFSTVLTLISLIYAIQYIGPTQTSILSALEPIVAVLISVVMFGERLTVNVSVGIILVLGGVLVNILLSERKKKIVGR